MIIDLKDFDSFYRQLNEEEKAKIIYFDDREAIFVKESWGELKINLDRLYNPQASELMNDINNLINTIEYYRKRNLGLWQSDNVISPSEFRKR